jgi:transposase
MSTGKRYTEAFKRAAVKQVVARGYSVAEVADRLGICTTTLYQWRSGLHGTPQEIKSEDDKVEITKLMTWSSFSVHSS